MDLERHARSLPSMGGTEIGPWLRRWASECSTNIVEVGSWLGAGTAQLALGARESGASIHVYDKWQATGPEVGKAGRVGLDLHEGQDTLPLVREHLAPFDVDITFHKGDVRKATWPGGPIGLYVDDAAKQPRTFRHIASTFGPHWEDGCVVVLMDYWFFETAGFRYRSQQLWAFWNRGRLERLEDRIGGTSAAAFRVLRR
jgi:hypothetical protein